MVNPKFILPKRIKAEDVFKTFMKSTEKYMLQQCDKERDKIPKNELIDYRDVFNTLVESVKQLEKQDQFDKEQAKMFASIGIWLTKNKKNI